MKIIFTPIARSNPYQYLLSNELKSLGVDVIFLSKLPKLLWFFSNKNESEIIHIHWISGLYKRDRKAPIRVAQLFFKLIIAKLFGYKIVWTAHNLFPHRSKYPTIDLAARYLITILSDAIITHCEYAKSQITEKYQRKKNISVIEHGSYTGLYQNQSSQLDSRKILNIGHEKFVYLLFGKLLAYKRVDYLIETFKLLNDKNAHLLIAGQCDEEYQRYLTQLCTGNDQITLDFGLIPSNRVQFYFNAANVLVIPFSEVLTSGSGILGLSFGLPIIAPRKGCLPEIITPETGILFDDKEIKGLYNAMEAIQTMDLDKMRLSAIRFSETIDWRNSSKKTLSIYNDLLIRK